jgi:hypothetical protein
MIPITKQIGLVKGQGRVKSSFLGAEKEKNVFIFWQNLAENRSLDFEQI